jgi:hypothetical protein
MAAFPCAYSLHSVKFDTTVQILECVSLLAVEVDLALQYGIRYTSAEIDRHC